MHFDWELGTAFEVLQGKRASSHTNGGISWFLELLWLPLRLRRGPLGISHVASRKPGRISSCNGEPRDFPRVAAGEYGLISS